MENAARIGHEGGGQIRKSLLRSLFSGVYMLRWNDKLRPCPLVEIDKQAHKMIVAALLLSRARASRGDSPEDYLRLEGEVVEGALFDYLFRMVVTDIKPPIFYRVKQNRERWEGLVGYGLKVLEPVLSPLGDFWERCQAWHRGELGSPEARDLLLAAHTFASRWEFSIIRPLNFFDREMPAIAENFREKFDSLGGRVEGLEDLLDEKRALGRLASFCGQLRFQVRWTQIPRIPQTDVLGHMFFVAALAYLCSLSLGLCGARRANNFFAGLFHDLPELLTRDIISPVKRSSTTFAKLIGECEREELDRLVLGPLKEARELGFVERLGHYLGLDAGAGSGEGPEFSQRVREPEGGVRLVESLEEMEGYNEDRWDAIDGRLVKTCDKLAAFMEAEESIRGGVSSSHLLNARLKLREELAERERHPAGLRLDSLMADFD